ncbi:MAG TPA: hypothetical protein VIX19_19125 [Terriglobales bacterium]
MKPHTIKGRTKSPAELGSLSPAEHVLERIQSLTAQLEAMQSELYGQITAPAEMLERRMLLEDRSSAQVFEQFRTALDQLRSILWLSTEQAAVDPTNSQRRHQLARAGGLLSTLSAHSRADASSRRQPREAVSFFDRLDRVIDTYMQEGGSIVDRAPGKRPKT